MTERAQVEKLPKNLSRSLHDRRVRLHRRPAIPIPEHRQHNGADYCMLVLYKATSKLLLHSWLLHLLQCIGLALDSLAPHRNPPSSTIIHLHPVALCNKLHARQSTLPELLKQKEPRGRTKVPFDLSPHFWAYSTFSGTHSSKSSKSQSRFNLRQPTVTETPLTLRNRGLSCLCFNLYHFTVSSLAFTFVTHHRLPLTCRTFREAFKYSPPDEIPSGHHHRRIPSF